MPHTYNTRASWALLATALIAGEPELKTAAIRNLEWALAQQRESGWFANNAFVAGQEPFTHTIAYAIRGLLESGVLLGEQPLHRCCAEGRAGDGARAARGRLARRDV